MTSHLAQELWYIVFSFLDFRSLARAQSVCSVFYQLGATNQFWRQLVNKHFVEGSIYFKPATPADESHKQTFKRLLGINLNGNWLSYTAREGQEQEEFLREKTIYLSTNIEKFSGGYTPTPLSEILNESSNSSNNNNNNNTTTTTTTANAANNNNNNNNNTFTTTSISTNTSNNNNNNTTTTNYYKTGSTMGDSTSEHTSKRRKSNTPATPTNNVIVHKSDFPHAFLGVGKAPWADIVVMGCQWGQYNCCVQLYFHSNYRTVVLYESSPSGRVMIGGFFSNWYNLIGMSSMCLPDTPRDTVMQVMNHAWAVHNSTHKWEGMLGDWTITFTFQDGRQQVYTFSIKNQRKMGLSGNIKGIYSKPTEIPTMMEQNNTHKYNYSEESAERNSPPFYNAPNNFDVAAFPTYDGHTINSNPPADRTPEILAVTEPMPAALSLQPEPTPTFVPEPDHDAELEDADDEDLLDEEDEHDDEDPATNVPSFLGVVTGHCVGLSFFTLGGTAYGKFITCVGQIEAEGGTREQVLRVPPDEYVIREVSMRGHFMEKLLDPHADQNTTPRAEEGTWRAVRRTRTFQMEI